MFGGVYQGKRVLVTGHTGFKGSWLCLWLEHLGAEVTGFSLDVPTEPAHFNLLDLNITDRRGDIRDLNVVRQVVQDVQPDLVFHMAAQPLVRLSYAQPVETFETNVMGTVHLLESCRNQAGLQGIVNITSDKCYENVGKVEGYVETDPMGGHDPYSASKGCAELVASSYARAFDDLPPLVSVRAGNVLGGGDWAADRLVPDVVRAMAKGEVLHIRQPHAVRPWQHVLEPLSGYLLLGQRLLSGDTAVTGGWNFAATHAETLPVAQLLDMLQTKMPFEYSTEQNAPQVHEAAMLTLNSGKAEREMGWHGVWDLPTMLGHTAVWYQAYVREGRVLSREQLAQYVADAKAQGSCWAGS